MHAVIIFRFGQWLYTQPKLFKMFLDPVYLVLNVLIQMIWGIEIPRSANIGLGLYIGHFGGITISPQAVIGERCNFSQSITIGCSGKGEGRGVPKIGDYVYIGPGARLFGKIKIGDNVKISANAVVYVDIPDNAILALAPGFKILSYKGNRN